MSMILLEPANTITHFNVEIKRRTISLTEIDFVQGIAEDLLGILVPVRSRVRPENNTVLIVIEESARRPWLTA
jgi:hypothetical protein